jgi:hypothetical protein
MLKKIIRKAIAKIKIRNAYIEDNLFSDLEYLKFALKNDHYDDDRCKNIIAELGIELPGAPAQTADPEKDDSDILPRFGNLLGILRQEVAMENTKIERRRMPSQNDLTRWALKKVVLDFYEKIGLPPDTPVVVNRFDDRLITELAPDFDVIADMWIEELDKLYRRDDKYGLIMEEIDKARLDLDDGMRGSAFEKQLDRYREEFMQKLVR